MKKKTNPRNFFLLAAATAMGLLLPEVPLPAQTVTKVSDLAANMGGGPNAPECRFTLVGTNLWFTTNKGGQSGVGGVFSFDLSNSNVTQLIDFDGTTGNKPQASSIMLANGVAWFTTSLGGTGGKGSLCSLDLTTHTLTNVFSFPVNGIYGTSPHSTPIQIGDDLWFTTSGGGLLADGVTVAQGTIDKYSLTDGTMTSVFTLDMTNTGRQPLGSSLIKAGDAYYYLTLAGGTNTAGGTANGAGILGKITFDNLNQPVFTKALDLPGRFLALPSADPVYDGTNFLYFTTVGVTTNPGAIVRFNLTDGTVSNLFSFVTNSLMITNFGKQLYGTPVLYNNELFFTTLSGGTAGKGILGKLTLSNNIVTKLVDFDGPAFGASPQYNGGTLYTNPVSGSVSIYWPIDLGGQNGFGTIVRVGWPPPPIVATLQKNPDGSVNLSWTGGYAPFGVDTMGSLAGGIWTSNWISGLVTNAVSFPAANGESYFRIQGANQ